MADRLLIDLASHAGKTLEQSEDEAAKMLRERGSGTIARVTAPSSDPDHPHVLLSVVTLSAEGRAKALRVDGTTREL